MRYAASLKGLEEHQAEERAKELLEAVGLRAEEKCRIRTLSGGMKQRLGIAQALLNDPRILILDEPTVGLDPKERVRFQNMIRRFSGDRKDRMILLSTHILSDVEQIADEMIVMKSGQIVYCGEAEKRETKIFIKEWISDEKSD